MFIRSVNCRNCKAELGSVCEGKIARIPWNDRMSETFRKNEFVAWNSNAITIREKGNNVTFMQLNALHVFCVKCNTMHDVRKTRGQNFRLFAHKRDDEILAKRTKEGQAFFELRELNCAICSEQLGIVRTIEFNEIPEVSLNGGVVVLEDHLEVVKWAPDIGLKDSLGRMLPDDFVYYVPGSYPEVCCPTCGSNHIFEHSENRAFIMKLIDDGSEREKKSPIVTTTPITCKTCQKVLGNVLRYSGDSKDHLENPRLADGKFWEVAVWENETRTFKGKDVVVEREGKNAQRVDTVICPACDTRHEVYGTCKRAWLLRREKNSAAWYDKMYAASRETT